MERRHPAGMKTEAYTEATDWSAGILACNAACGVKRLPFAIAAPFLYFALMQAGMPALQPRPQFSACADHAPTYRA